MIDGENLNNVSNDKEVSVTQNMGDPTSNKENSTNENISLNAEASSFTAQENTEHHSTDEKGALEINAQLITTNDTENITSAVNNSVDGEKVTVKINEDIEITYTLGQTVLPRIKSTPMIPKINDVLSGNMPFQAILDHKDVRI